MPGIGNPNQVFNSFSKIRKHESKPQKSSEVKTEENVGETLNRIAGARQEQQFVDRDKHNKLDKDSFLKLLSAQLANQDPLKPVDQKKFAADMAQFAQLEQLTNMNTKLDKNTSNIGSELKYMGASFVGKSIHTSGTSVKYNGQDLAVDLPFYLSKPAQKIMVRVYDGKNNMMAQLEHEGMGQGTHSLTWNGKQMDGVRATPGDYRFEVTGYDEQYNQFKGETKAEGVVTGVSFDNGEAVLEVDGHKKVALRDVDSFFLPKQKNHAAKNPEMKKQLMKQFDASYNNPNMISNEEKPVEYGDQGTY